MSRPGVLPHFEVDDPERSHRIWQRHPLAVLMDNQMKMKQKIVRAAFRYMHNNPLHERWNLATAPRTTAGRRHGFTSRALTSLAF